MMFMNVKKLNKIYNRYFALPEEMNNMSNNFHKYKIINYKSKNNNCGLVCLIRATGNKANQIKPDMLRKKYNIEKNTLLSVNQLGIISMDYFKNNLIAVNNVGDELYNSNSGFENTIFLLLSDQH